MADVNANIGVHIDTSAALAELKALQRQLANFHSSVSKSSAAAAMAQKGLQTNLLNSINATGKFRAQMGLVRTSTESFTHALEKNKLSMREYFRYAGGSTRTFGKLFKQEFNTIGKVAEERVKKMQTQYIKMGRDASGAMKAISITPNTLNMKDYSTKLAVAAQKQAILNQLLRQGSTNLLNFGKNTQWAGRQLMVGFTVPLLYLGGAAAKVFMDLEKQAVRFKRVYGDMFTTTDETNKALEEVQALAEGFTKYGVAVVKTMEMAANAAAMGKTGADLMAQVSQATRLAVLGGVEQEQALETTISVTNAFGVAAEDLASKINFLNAVENQTVVSIEDLTIAIPKAGPVVQQLGGDVEDLAFFLTAMKEGGINASEGANALKSGLASLINPTKKASDMLAGMGINIKGIVEANKGNIKDTVIGFAQALDTLDPLSRARAIEQLFGKFQFSRLSTLFQNVTKDGTQASRVLELAGASIEELAILSERELKTLEDSVGTDFKESIEQLKLALAPIGKEFLKAVTPIAKVLGNFLEKFNNLGDGTKKFIVIATTLVGVIGPVLLMTFGLLMNAVANIIKLFVTMRTGFHKAGANSAMLAQQTQYLNSEQLESATVAASLNQAHTRLTQSFSIETTAVKLLRQAYLDATLAARNFTMANPGMMMPGGKFKPGPIPKKFASGVDTVPGTGNKDTVPAMLTPGEAVIPKRVAQDNRYAPIIDAMVNGTLQGFNGGSTGVHPVNIPTDFLPEDKVYNAKSAPGAKNIQKFLTSLKKNPNGTYSYSDGKFTRNNITLKEIKDAIASRDARFSDNKFTASEIKQKLGLEGTGSAARSAKLEPGERLTINKTKALLNKGMSGTGKEIYAIQKRLEKYGLEKGQIDKLLQIEKSHIVKSFNAKGEKVFTLSNIMPDYGYVNQFVSNSLGPDSELSKHLMSMDKKQLKKLGINKAELKSIIDGNHPTTQSSARTLSQVAKYVLNPRNDMARTLGYNSAKTKNLLYQADALDAGLKERLKTDFYKGGLRNLTNLLAKQKIAVSQKEMLIDKNNQASIVKGSTGKPKPAAMPMIGGSLQDNRLVSASEVSKVIPKKQVRLGIKGPGSFAIGATQGFDNPSVTKPGSGFRMGNVAPNMRVADTQMQALITAVNQNTAALKTSSNATKKATKANTAVAASMNGAVAAGAGVGVAPVPVSAKDAKREARARRSEKVGRVAGPVAGIASMGAMAGYMTGNTGMGNAMMGLAGVAMLAQMVTGPISALVAVLALAVAGFFLYGKMLKKAREEGMNLARAMSMTSDTLKGLSVLSGKVGASEIQARKRQTLLDPLGEPQRKFGQNALKSDTGKKILSDVEQLVKQNFSSEQIGKILGTNLSQAVLQGAISTDQARSIASALGEQLGSYDIPINVSAKISTLLGPDGENLEKSKLEVALAIKKDSLENFEEARKIFEKGKKNSLLQTLNVNNYGKSKNPLKVLTTPITSFFNQKKENAKLDAAQIQLGFELISQSQQMLDSINEEYDKKVKIAKTEKEINDLQSERIKSIGALNTANRDTLDTVIKISKALSDDAFNTTVEESLNARLKDAPAAAKITSKIALEDVKSVKNQELRRTLQIGLVSQDGLTPESIISLTEFVASSEKASKTMSIFIKTNGFAEANTLTALFGKFTGSKFGKDITPVVREFITEYISNNSVNLKDDLAALNALGSFKEQYDITLDVNSNGIEDMQLATKSLELIKGFDDKIDKKFLATVVDPEGNFTEFTKNFDILSNKKDKISKFLYVNYKLGLVDPEVRTAAKLAYPNLPEDEAIATLLAKGFNEATFKPPVSTPDAGSGERDTTLDDLLKRLKLVRDASINARGGIDELRRVMNSAGGDIKIFKGINQQLRAQGINKDFLDFVGDLDPAIQKKFITIKNGIVAITADGKKLAKALNEAVIGELQDGMKDQIQGLRAQSAKFTELRAAGLSAAEALSIVTNEQVALALASGATKEEIDQVIAGLRELRRNEKRTQDIINPEERINKEVAMAMEYFDVLEREARNIYQPQIDAANKLIDINDRLIQDQQRILEEQVDRPLEKFSQDLAEIARATEKINEKYDAQEKALQDISDIQDDIAAKESSRITIADALTRGDISAAAKAIQERRAEEARKAKENSSRLLQIAREKEISKLTNTDGLTKIQIEEKIYALEQKRLEIATVIRGLEDKSYSINKLSILPAQDKLKLELDAIQAQKDKWEAVALGVDGARVRGVEYQAVLRGHEDTLKRMKALWDGITSKELGAASLTTFANPATETDAEKAARLKKQLDDDAAEVRAQIADLTNIIKDINDSDKTKTKTLDPKPKIVVPPLSAGLYGSTPAIPTKIPTPTASASGPRGGSYTIIPPTKTPYNPLSAFSTPANSAVSYRSRAMGGVIPKVRYEPIPSQIQGYKQGGIIPKYFVAGGYSRGSDTVPAMLTPGEFVVRRNAVESFGVNNLNKINDGSYGGSSVYNYSLNVNVKSDSSPDDIARTVMTQIKRIDNQRIKGQR